MEMARHQRICKQFCTIQIKVTANMPQILDMVKKQALQIADIWDRKLKFLSKITPKISSRFCWLSFHTKKLNKKHRVIFAPLPFITNKEEFSLIWVQF